MKKIISVFICCVMIFSLAATAMAATTFTAENPDILPPGQPLNSRAMTVPTSSTALPYNAVIDNLTAESYTYTSYYFVPGDSNLRILGTMYATTGNCNDNNRVRFSLYQRTSSGSIFIDSYTTDGFEDAGLVAHTFKGLDANGKYFFSIANAASRAEAEDSAVKGEFLID